VQISNRPALCLILTVWLGLVAPLAAWSYEQPPQPKGIDQPQPAAPQPYPGQPVEGQQQPEYYDQQGQQPPEYYEDQEPPEYDEEAPPLPEGEGQPAVKAKPRKPPGPGEVSLVFKNVDIRVLIQFISKLTGKNYIVSNKVAGRVTIVSPGPVSVDQALRIFEAVLAVHGFTTVPEGDVIKVIPTRDARRLGVEMIPPHQIPPPGSESMVSQLVSVKYSTASELRNILIPLATRYAYITSHAETNSILITDLASNVRRLVKIIEALDKPGLQNRIKIVRLKYAGAREMSQLMDKLFTAADLYGYKKEAAPPPEIGGRTELKSLADERINAIILLGAQADIERAVAIIGELDQPEQEGQFNVHVIYLKYAVAEDMAQVFNKLAGQATETPRSETAGQKGAPAPPEEKLKVISGAAKVVADRATNALIISATPQEFKVIESVAAKLDVARTMVYVEAVILEMSASKSLEFGINWFGASKASGGLVTGGVGGRPSSTPPQSSSPGWNFTALGPTITFGDLQIPNLSVLIRAVQSDSDIRIVATPQILTADNQEATIQVAQNLPFITSTQEGTTTDSVAIQSYEYRDVGYSLTVTPRISDNRIIRLAVEAEAKSVVQAQTTDSQGNVLLAPTTNVRHAETTILTRDGELVAIGGLIGTELEKTGDQVPCLGNAPGLGWAFKTRSDTGKRTNLLIFLSPHILTSQEAIKALTDEKVQESRKDVPEEKKDLLSPYRPKIEEPEILKRSQPEKSD